MKKSIEQSEIFGCDVIMDGEEYGHPDNEKLNRQTGQYTGTVEGKPVSGIRLKHRTPYITFYYYTVD